ERLKNMESGARPSMSCPQPEAHPSALRPARSAPGSAYARCRTVPPRTRCRPMSPAHGGQMTAVDDKAGETGIDMAETPCLAAETSAGGEGVTREVCRGAGRLLRSLSFAVVNDLSLANGRRADIV